MRWEVAPARRSRRSVLERLALALPSPTRRFTAFVMRRPAGSRVRRWALTRSVRDWLAANNRGDYESLASLFHPDLELRMSAEDTTRLGVDLEPLYTGPDGYIDAVRTFKGPFAAFHWDIREVVDPGGNRFAGITDMVGRGSESGIEMSTLIYNLWELEDGLLRRQWTFWSEAALLDALTKADPHG